MILRHVYLALDLDDPRLGRLSSDFQFQTRALCNYVEKQLRPVRFSTPDFSKICIFGTSVSPKPAGVQPESALVAQIPFDLAEFESKRGTQRQELFIQMLRTGFAVCAGAREIPSPTLLAALDDFRAGGFVNKWVHKSKLLRPYGIKAHLCCELTMQRFILTLRITRRDAEIASYEVLDTKPDEIIFQHQFKEVVATDRDVVVLDRFGKEVFSRPIADILARA